MKSLEVQASSAERDKEKGYNYDMHTQPVAGAVTFTMREAL